MTGRVLDHQLVGARRPSGRVYGHEMLTLASGAKGRVLDQELTTTAAGAPGTPVRGRVFSHEMVASGLTGAVSVNPAGRPLEPKEPFTITAVGTQTGPWEFDPGSPTTILTGSGGTRTGLAPVVEPDPVLDGSGIWHGVDNVIFMSITVPGVGSIDIPIAPVLVGTRIQPSGQFVPWLTTF